MPLFESLGEINEFNKNHILPKLIQEELIKLMSNHYLHKPKTKP